MRKRGKSVTEEGARLARYCERMGCTVRTGRTHRAANDPRWVEFLASDAGAEAVPAETGAGVAAAPPAAGGHAELLHRQEMTQAALRQWRANARGYDDAQRQRCGADTLRKWEGAVSRSQARYEASLAAEVRLRTQLGMLITHERVADLKRELAPLGLLVRGLKDRVARGILEPHARDLFFEAFGSAERAWNAEVEEMNRKIDAVLPCF